MRKVLIVEDDIFISAIFSFFLKDLGYEVAGRYQTGQKALECCATERPDVVLMDIHIEGEIDGIQTAERIQRDFDIPVIFISSDTSSTVVERAITSNSYGYLVKPVQKNELGITIELAYYKHKLAVEQKSREQGYRLYLSELPAPVIIIQDGRIKYVNMQALGLLRTHYLEDVLGLPLLDYVNKDSHQAVIDYTTGLLKSNDKSQRVEVTMKTFHGLPFEVALIGSQVQFAGKCALQLMLHDITTEKSAIRSYQLLREAIFHSGVPVLVINEQLVIEEHNDAFKRLVKSKTSLQGASSLLPGNGFSLEEGCLQTAIKAGHESFDLPIVVDDRQYSGRGYRTINPVKNRVEILLKVY